MININKIRKNFSYNLNEIDKINKLGNDVIELTVDLLLSLKEQNEQLTAFVPYKEKLDNTISQIRNLKTHKIVADKYQVIFNQSVVLIISTFEIFLSEFVTEVANNMSEMIKWNEKEKISINPTDYYYTDISFGRIVLKHIKQKYSFQDIQSIRRLIKDYFGFEINIPKDDLDDLIFYQAARNAIVHNLSQVDEEFRNQIRTTKYYIKYVAHEHKLQLKKYHYDNAKESYKKLFEKILDGFRQKVLEKYEYDVYEDVGYEDQEYTAELEEDFIDKVKKLLPVQPWPKGVNLLVSNKLNQPKNKVNAAISTLIDRGVFKYQVNGKLYVPEE